MGFLLSVLLAWIALVTATEKKEEENVNANKGDDLLAKVTRELLLLEIEELKKEVESKHAAESHKEPPIIDSNELVQEKKSHVKKNTPEEEIRQKLMAVLEKKMEAEQSSQTQREDAKAKRMVDLSRVQSSCVDDFGEKVCTKFLMLARGFCKWEKGAAAKCKKTCGRCGVFDVYPRFCKVFVNKCHDSGVEGDFIRKKCAKTCSQGSNFSRPCEDDKLQANFCPMWKQMDMCKEEELMNRYCPKTCGYC